MGAGFDLKHKWDSMHRENFFMGGWNLGMSGFIEVKSPAVARGQ